MIKAIVINDFSYKDFNKLKNIKRRRKNIDGKLFIGDVFECDIKTARYLLGDNPLSKPVIKLIEVNVSKK